MKISPFFKRHKEELDEDEDELTHRSLNTNKPGFSKINQSEKENPGFEGHRRQQKKAAFSPIHRTDVFEDEDDAPKKRKKLPWKRILLTVGIVLLIATAAVISFCVFSKKDSSSDDKISAGETVEVSSGEQTLSLFLTKEENIAEDADTGAAFVNNELILTAENGISKQQVETVISGYGGKIVGINDYLNTYQVQFDRQYNYSQLNDLINDISRSNGIKSADVNYYLTIESDDYPNDSEWKDKWNDDDKRTWGVRAINAPEMWEAFYDKMNHSVHVGVYDTQFYEDHEDLNYAEIFCNQFDKTETTHGTHVSGTIAAIYNNEKGISGVAPVVDLYAASWLGDAQRTVKTDEMGITVDNLEASLTYLICVKECKAINFSCYFPDVQGNIDVGYHVVSALLQYVAEGYDFLLVKAAGNYCEDADMDAVFSMFTAKELSSRVITVGACGKDEDGSIYIWESSNYGDSVDLVAPGKDIYSTVFSNFLNIWTYSDYGYSNGTSMAAPHVTGVAAAMWSVNPDLTGSEIKSIICSTASGNYFYQDDAENYQKSSNFSTARQYSYPMLDAYAAVSKAYDYGQQQTKNNNSNSNNGTASGKHQNQSELMGTYYSTDGIQAFTFGEDNSIEMNAFGVVGSGTYEIDGDYLVVQYKISIFGDQEYTWKVQFDYGTGDSIYIASTEFIKAD